MKMSAWSSQYAAYATAHRRTPEEQLAHDIKAWPGGRMAGFMLWMRAAWNAWAIEVEESPAWGGAWSDDQRNRFFTWLPDYASAIALTEEIMNEVVEEERCE